MIARGLVPQWPTDAIKLYPDLFSREAPRTKPSREAAKKTYQRVKLTRGRDPAGGQTGDIPL